MRIPSAERTPGTERDYLQRYRRLVNRFQRESGKCLDEDDSIAHDFVDWLSDMKPNLRAASWRQYRAACVYGLRCEGFEAAADRLAAIGTEGCKPPPRRRDRVENPIVGSERKYKSLPKSAYRRLLSYLNDRPGIWSRIAAIWIEAGRLTGLRPCEWRQAVLLEDGDVPRLVVKNAKATHGRAHGETRTLLLVGMSEIDLRIIRTQLRNVHRHRENWPGFYRSARKALATANRKLWPNPASRRMTLYSARHQFIADAKRAGLTLMEIAALVGHAVPETAQVHYGRRRSGWKRGRGRFRAAPLRSEVARVRCGKRNNAKKPRFSK